MVDLIQPEAKLRLILNNSKQPYLLLDRSFSIIVLNRAAKELSRRLIGTSLQEGGSFLDQIPAIKRAEYLDLLENSLSGESILIEKSVADLDGHLDWFELLFHPARDDDSHIIGVSIDVRTITDRKTTEECYLNLYESEKEQRQVAEALQEAGAFLSQTLDFGKILDGVLEQVSKVVYYDIARIFLVEDHQLRIARERSTLQDELVRLTPPVSSNEISIESVPEFSWIIANNQPLVKNKEIQNSPSSLASIESTNSWVAVPIQSQGQVIAIIWLEKSERDYYNSEHIRLLSAFAGQAALALQNARLFDSAQRRIKESETLRQAAAAVTSELGLSQVLDRILINLKKVVHYDSATLYLLEGDQLQEVAESGFINDMRTNGKVIPASNELFQESLNTGRPLVLEDTRQDARFEMWSRNSEIRGWIGIPLHLRGRIIGYMTLDSHQENAYSDVEASLAQVFANEATIALENARLFQELQTLATFDQLTGIWNRRHFFHLAKIEFQRARRHRQPLSAILFDLDSFKTINDTYGHAVGDQVLRGVAQVCKQNLRQIDILGRYGGEEFMVLLPNTPLASALHVAERLCGIIAATPYETERGAVHVSASFGIAETDQLTQDIDTLLKYADRAVYLSKHRGKNRVTILDDPNAP